MLRIEGTLTPASPEDTRGHMTASLSSTESRDRGPREASSRSNRRRPNVILRVLDRATRPPWLTFYAVLNLSLSLMIGVRHHRAVDGPLGPGGDIASGDFMAFYTGAMFVNDGRGRELYNLATQNEYQLELTGPPNTQWQPYINPPLLAVALAPLASLPYRYAYWSFAVLTLLAFIGSMVLFKPKLTHLARDRLTWLTTLALTASWLPLFRSMAGGQNSLFTILLLVGLYAAWRDNRMILAGVALGLLSYKPQFGLLLGAVFIARGMWVALTAAGATAAAHYALGAVFMGADWPLRLLDTLRVHRTLEQQIIANHFSILPTAGYSLPGPFAVWVAAIGIAGVAILCVWQARRIGPADTRFPILYGLLVCGTLLVSPHLQHYDVAILAIPTLLTLDYLLGQGRPPRLIWRLLLAVGFLFYPIYHIGASIGFQPLFLWLLSVFIWDWALLARPSAPETEVEQHEPSAGNALHGAPA